jgi:hypothetical protein
MAKKSKNAAAAAAEPPAKKSKIDGMSSPAGGTVVGCQGGGTVLK